VGTLQDSSLIARPLGAYRIVNCASPDYLHRHGVPQRIEDLAHHRLIHYVPHFGARPEGFEYFDGQTYRTVSMPGALTVNNAEAYEAACLAGLGIIQAPVVGMHALLVQGRLVEVLPECRAEPMPVTLLYAARRNLSQRVRIFMEWLAEILQPCMDTNAEGGSKS
jgi:DNA-binding transcriptional LysR family regulator